jgi:tricorn protease-like protein
VADHSVYPDLPDDARRRLGDLILSEDASGVAVITKRRIYLFDVNKPDPPEPE